MTTALLDNPVKQQTNLALAGIKKVLVTGASEGIGLETLFGLLDSGVFDLLITGRNEAKLLAAKNALVAYNSKAKVSFYVCDHSSADQVETLVETLLFQSQNDLPLPDVVIANVGVNPIHEFGPKKTANTGAESLLENFNTNVVNAHRLISPLLMHLVRLKGKVILVGSQSYLWGIKGQVAYNVSKSALVGYKNTLVSEYGAKGLFCHLINPGIVANHRNEKMRAVIGESISTPKKDVVKAIIDALNETTKNGLEINI